MQPRPQKTENQVSWDQWYESLQQWTYEMSGYVAPEHMVDMKKWIHDESGRSASEVVKALRKLYEEKLLRLQKRQRWSWLLRFFFDVSTLEQEVAQLDEVVTTAEKQVKDVLPKFLSAFFKTRKRLAENSVKDWHSKRTEFAIKIDETVRSLPEALRNRAPRHTALPAANPERIRDDQAYFKRMEVWCDEEAPRLMSMWTVYLHIEPIFYEARRGTSAMNTFGNV
ncbi:MAG: hypothetical protein WA174_13950, partial [Rhodoferax sp.]